MRCVALCACALLVAAGAHAQAGSVGGVGPQSHPWKATKAQFDTYSCTDGGPFEGVIVAVTDAADTTTCPPSSTGTSTVTCQCVDGTWTAFAGASGSGDVTAVGDCATGACFSSVTARHAFLGPVGGGTAAFRALVEADISDLSHTVDTDDQTAPEVPYAPTTNADWTDPDPTEAGGALDTLADRLTTEEAKADDDVPEAGDFGALALTGDVTSTGLTTTLAADSVGLTELSACTGPDEIVEYGASGVPSCIATPSGGGGDATGIDADGDGTREISVSGGAISFDANDDGNPAEMVLNSNAQLVLTYPGYGYPFGEVVKITTTGQTLSFYQSGAGGRAQVYSTNRLSLQGGSGVASIELADGGVSTIKMMDRVVNSPSTATCADSGDANPGAVTITPTTSFVQLTNSDANGCTVTLSESGAVAGQGVEIVIVSSAGGTVDFADTAGVTELAGAFSAALWDTLTLRYTVDRWVETARSNN